MRVRGTAVGSPKLKPSDDNWGNDWDDDWGGSSGGGGGGDGWDTGNDWENPPAPPSVPKVASHTPQRASALSTARRDAPGSSGGGRDGGGSCSSGIGRDSTKENTALRPSGRRLPVRLICLLGVLVLITMQSASRAPSAEAMQANAPLGGASAQPPPLPAGRHRHDSADAGAAEPSEDGRAAVAEDRHPGCSAWANSGECMKNPGYVTVRVRVRVTVTVR